jgi:hypothetical protein
MIYEVGFDIERAWFVKAFRLEIFNDVGMDYRFWWSV